MSDPYSAAAGALAWGSTSAMPQYRMPDGSYTSNEKLARQAWIEHLEWERVRNGG